MLTQHIPYSKNTFMHVENALDYKCASMNFTGCEPNQVLVWYC